MVQSSSNGDEAEARPLRRGWTTGTCAAAAARAAAEALFTGQFPDPVTVALPGGQRPGFALAWRDRGDGWAAAGIVKDAGDDPDVTHGAQIRARVETAPPGHGVTFRAGEGVGTVTRPGLPVAVGEPAINPVPRVLIARAVAEAAAAAGGAPDEVPDVVVEISIPGGEALARQTLNGRLGILGGLSILGTTGIVVPYSCGAWIASVHRGIDVARAGGLSHIAACTGSASEAAVVAHHGLPEMGLIDMGDFAGGTLKYLRYHPVARLTLCGGFAKFSKLAQGALDLHSKRSTVDLPWLALHLAALGAGPELVEAARGANTAAQVLGMALTAGLPLADRIAALAQRTALDALDGAPVAVEVLTIDRAGAIVGQAPWR
jgi:cobalt-precorrin-5B (C1)-methyltransferase